MANPVRLSALCLLIDGETSVGNLADQLDMSQSALSQHLKILKDAGVVTMRRDHRVVYYKTSDEKVLQLIGLLKDLYCPTE